MRFIDTDKGFVNLNHVVSVRSRVQTVKSGRETFHTLIGTDGDPLGEVRDLSFSPYSLDSEQVVPAAPGEFGWVVFPPDDNIRPATVDDLTVSTYRIIAWRIPQRPNSEPEPVFIDPPCSEEIVLLPQLEGRICRQYSGEYNSLDHAKADILREFQKRWDNLLEHLRAPKAVA